MYNTPTVSIKELHYVHYVLPHDISTYSRVARFLYLAEVKF